MSKWTLAQILHKYDYEGLEYILNSVSPESVEDKYISELLTVIQEPLVALTEYLNEMTTEDEDYET